MLIHCPRDERIDLTSSKLTPAELSTSILLNNSSYSLAEISESSGNIKILLTSEFRWIPLIISEEESSPFLSMSISWKAAEIRSVWAFFFVGLRRVGLGRCRDGGDEERGDMLDGVDLQTDSHERSYTLLCVAER